MLAPSNCSIPYCSYTTDSNHKHINKYSTSQITKRSATLLITYHCLPHPAARFFPRVRSFGSRCLTPAPSSPRPSLSPPAPAATPRAAATTASWSPPPMFARSCRCPRWPWSGGPAWPAAASHNHNHNNPLYVYLVEARLCVWKPQQQRHLVSNINLLCCWQD